MNYLIFNDRFRIFEFSARFENLNRRSGGLKFLAARGSGIRKPLSHGRSQGSSRHPTTEGGFKDASSGPEPAPVGRGQIGQRSNKKVIF